MIEQDNVLNAVGTLLIALGVVAAIFGDAQVSTSRGIVSRMFRWRAGEVKRSKLAIGVALVASGVAILLR